MRFAAQWSEHVLYVLRLTQPIRFFVGQLPALIGQDRPLAKQLLIVLHAPAALYHHFWRRDGTLEAMLPARMRRPQAPAERQKGRVYNQW